MPRILGFLVAAWAVGMALPAQAQQAVLSQLYGQGVHEFYGGDYQAARQSLTEAAANDSRDPRVYYYRALANLRLGDESAAKSDFDTAAALEFTPAGRQFAVSRSLQRVQGRERQTLEKHRAQAKMTAYRAAEQRRQARYGREQQADFDELREQAVAPATAIDRGFPGAETVDVPKRPTTVIDPATAADSAADEQAPASGIGGIVGRALGNGDAPPSPPVVAPTTPPPAAAVPTVESGGLFGDDDEPAVEPAAEEPDALEVTEDPVPADDILDPEPEAAPAATKGPASEPTAPAPADEGDPFADSDDTKAPADEAAAPPTTDEAPLAEEAPFEEEPALEEPAKTAPAAPAVEDTLEAPAAEMPATEAPATAEDSLDDALPADAPPADPALESEAPVGDPAASAADPLGEEPLGEAPAEAIEDPAAPADVAPTADPLAEEPAADPLFDEPAAEPAAGDPAADAPLEDPAADSADPALEEPAGESLEEMPAEPAAEESLEEAPAEQAPADEAPLPE